MATFIMLTRLSQDAVNSPKEQQLFDKRLMEKIHYECPDVKWLNGFASLGSYDYVDIFEAPDIETANKVSILVKIYSHAHSEIWSTTEWHWFRELMKNISHAA